MTVSEQIIQVIDKLCEKFGMAIDWTGENVIPYIETLGQKLVTYEIATSVAWILICTAMSIGCILATKKFAPTFKNGLKRERGTYNCDWVFATAFAIIVLVIVFGIIIGTIVTQTMDIIKCATFPEMYVFEYVQNLINSQ